MRESPLPDLAGAGFFDADGRVVVAIAKSMGLCGLRPEGGAELAFDSPAAATRLVIHTLDTELSQMVVEMLAGEPGPERP